MKKKIMIAIPTRGEMDFRFVHCLTELTMDCHRMEDKYEFSVAIFPKMLVAAARELAVEKALEYGFDYIFMVDDDMILPRGIMHRLLSHDKDVVGAMSFERLGDNSPNIYTLLTQEIGDDGRGALIGSFKYGSIINYAEMRDASGLCEVDAVGFGCVLINTRIFKDREDGPAFKPTWFMAQFNIGEDFFFCYRAKTQHNIKIYADCHPRWMVGHLGEKPVIDEAMMLDKLAKKKAVLETVEIANAK